MAENVSQVIFFVFLMKYLYFLGLLEIFNDIKKCLEYSMYNTFNKIIIDVFEVQKKTFLRTRDKYKLFFKILFSC